MQPRTVKALVKGVKVPEDPRGGLSSRDRAFRTQTLPPNHIHRGAPSPAAKPMAVMGVDKRLGVLKAKPTHQSYIMLKAPMGQKPDDALGMKAIETHWQSWDTSRQSQISELEQKIRTAEDALSEMEVKHRKELSSLRASAAASTDSAPSSAPASCSRSPAALQ